MHQGVVAKSKKPLGIVHKAPYMQRSERDEYLEFEVAPYWDPDENEHVFNDFAYPAADTKVHYWHCKAASDDQLQKHPAWVWWCWFIHHLFAEEPMVGYWHRYRAHLIQRPDEPPAAFLYLYSKEQGAGKNIAMHIIQAILGDSLWFGGPRAHKRLLKNDKQGEGLRCRMWLMDEAYKLTQHENLVLTGNCDTPQRNKRVLHRNGGLVSVALRQFIVANHDNVVPPSSNGIRRQAAFLCRPTFVKKSNQKVWGVLYDGMKHNVGASRRPDELDTYGIGIISECYRRLKLGNWSPEDILQTALGKQMRYGVDVYNFVRTLGFRKYSIDSTTKHVVANDRPDPKEWSEYDTSSEELYAGFKQWMRDDEARSPNSILICRTQLMHRLTGIMEDLGTRGGLVEIAMKQVKILAHIIDNYFKSRKEEEELGKQKIPGPVKTFDASFGHYNADEGHLDYEEEADSDWDASFGPRQKRFKAQ